jgi:hypothetical protein
VICDEAITTGITIRIKFGGFNEELKRILGFFGDMEREIFGVEDVRTHGKHWKTCRLIGDEPDVTEIVTDAEDGAVESAEESRGVDGGEIAHDRGIIPPSRPVVSPRAGRSGEEVLEGGEVSGGKNNAGSALADPASSDTFGLCDSDDRPHSDSPKNTEKTGLIRRHLEGSRPRD